MFFIILVAIIIVVQLFIFVDTEGKPNKIVEFNGKTYKVSTKRFNLIQRAQQGDEKAQYEIITEYYEAGRSKQFIAELCFFYTEKLAGKDLGVLTELGDLYFEGVGTERDTVKAAEMYRKALEIYDNNVPDVYIPERSDDYRKFLQTTLEKYEAER